jgi:uncharacterized membrane protein
VAILRPSSWRCRVLPIRNEYGSGHGTRKSLPCGRDTSLAGDTLASNTLVCRCTAGTEFLNVGSVTVQMDSELLINVVSRWIHVGTAIVLVGGTTFLRLVVHPSLQGEHAELMSRIRGRWKKFVHGGIALFLISGFFNYFRAMPLHKGDGLYHALVGTKILLAFVVFFLASALVGRSAGTQKFRDNAPRWTAIVVLLSFLIIGISGFVKVRGGVSSVSAASAATGTQQP